MATAATGGTVDFTRPLTLAEVNEALATMSENIASMRHTAVEIGEDAERGWESADYRRIAKDIVYWVLRREEMVELAHLLRGNQMWSMREVREGGAA